MTIIKPDGYSISEQLAKLEKYLFEEIISEVEVILSNYCEEEFEVDINFTPVEAAVMRSSDTDEPGPEFVQFKEDIQAAINKYTSTLRQKVKV